MSSGQHQHGGYTRRGFLRRAAAITGTGLGLAMLPLDTAQATGGQCCRERNGQCPVCAGNYQRYLCSDRCTSSNYCACYPQSRPECFDVACR